MHNRGFVLRRRDGTECAMNLIKCNSDGAGGF
jgi:hypothetical protein